MWIMTKEGFFSVVAHRNKAARYLIRARRREHLEALLEAHWRQRSPQPSIIELHHADYPARIEVPKTALQILIRSAAEDIDYPNFKAAVPSRGCYINFLHDVWALGRSLLDDRRNPTHNDNDEF